MWRTQPSLLNEFARLNREMDRLFVSMTQPTMTSFPPINIWLRDDEIVATGMLPGIDADALHIQLENNTLTISGTRAAPTFEGARTVRRERTLGEFERKFHLPFRVDAEQVKATFTDGILTITLPRLAQDMPRKIEVKTA